MKKNEAGLAIHCRHDVLVEYCYDYNERVEAIKRDKPKSEQEIRLRLFKMLSKEAVNALPDELRRAYVGQTKACAKWDEESTKWDEAYEKYSRIALENRGRKNGKKANIKWDKVIAKGEKAQAKRDAAFDLWKEAYARWNRKDQDRWHQKWCGCKEWDGIRLCLRRDG